MEHTQNLAWDIVTETFYFQIQPSFYTPSSYLDRIKDLALILTLFLIDSVCSFSSDPIIDFPDVEKSIQDVNHPLPHSPESLKTLKLCHFQGAILLTSFKSVSPPFSPVSLFLSNSFVGIKFRATRG